MYAQNTTPPPTIATVLISSHAVGPIKGRFDESLYDGQTDKLLAHTTYEKGEKVGGFVFVPQHDPMPPEAGPVSQPPTAPTMQSVADANYDGALNYINRLMSEDYGEGCK